MREKSKTIGNVSEEEEKRKNDVQTKK